MESETQVKTETAFAPAAHPINIRDEAEIANLMEKLGVSYKQLRQAISKVGPQS